jgi:N-acetylmuramoyl-L-alanine amidase
MSASAADVARMRAVMAYLRAHDVRVIEVAGWQLRGTGEGFAPRMFVCHWDASTRKAGEWGALGIVASGRGGDNPVPGPLSQTQVARCLDGVPKVAIVAAGRANHAGRGGPYRLPSGVVIPKDSANRYAYGTEHANDGVGEPVTPASLYAYSVLAAAYRSVLGVPTALPAGCVIAHFEWTPRKQDPKTYIDAIRTGSSRALITEAPPEPEEDDMPTPDEYATAVVAKLTSAAGIEPIAHRTMVLVRDQAGLATADQLSKGVVPKIQQVFDSLAAGDGPSVPAGTDTRPNSIKRVRADIDSVSDQVDSVNVTLTDLAARLAEVKALVAQMITQMQAKGG